MTLTPSRGTDGTTTTGLGRTWSRRMNPSLKTSNAMRRNSMSISNMKAQLIIIIYVLTATTQYINHLPKRISFTPTKTQSALLNPTF